MTRRRDRDLAAYYDAEAAAGVRSELSERRLALHRQSSELFGASGVRTIADVGAGTGLDLERFRSHGFEVAGVDLSVGTSA